MKRPSFQFYPGDWMKDPAVSLCSPATRGIWFDLICAMYEARKASLTGTADTLSRIARCSAAEFTAAVSELQITEAADVQSDGVRVTVTCRRVSRVLSGREATKARVAKHRQHGERADSTERVGVTQSVTPLKRESNAAVTPASSSSSSDLKAAAAADVPTERIGDLDHIRNALTGVGFSAGEAIRLSGKPGLTVRTVEWLIDRAREQRATKPKAFIASGINGGWTPDAGPLESKPASDYKAPRSGVWG